MGKKKDAIEIEEGQEVAAKTIVGGRPYRRQKVRMAIPAGIEKTLYRAAVDRAFRRALLEDRASTLADPALHLTDTESSILSTIPDARLEHMIGQIRPAGHGKRKFMRTVASAVATLAAGTAVLATEGCEADRGAQPDVPTDVETDDTYADIGILPDVPLDTAEDPVLDPESEDVVVDDTGTGADAGVIPDVPEDPWTEPDADDSDADDMDAADADDSDADDAEEAD